MSRRVAPKILKHFQWLPKASNSSVQHTRDIPGIVSARIEQGAETRRNCLLLENKFKPEEVSDTGLTLYRVDRSNDLLFAKYRPWHW
jgi:hypothetical protein